MKLKSFTLNISIAALTALAIVLAIVCYMPINYVKADDNTAPVITLSSAFSDEGMATEIDCAYGKVLNIPEPVAVFNGQRIEAQTEVKYLAADGWEIYELPQSRILRVGDANSGDENKVAMYSVSFFATAGGTTTRLVYTVYAGLQFSNRSAWSRSDEVGFVGEEMSVPTTKIQYKYKNQSGKSVVIPIEPEFTLTYYSTDGGNGEIVELNGESYFVPERAGRYEATYATPQTVERDGTVFIRGSVSLTRVINVYDEPSNPLEGEDGIYECTFSVGGTSDTGKEMIASSCASMLQIEKVDGLYYMHFTQTAANYMFNLKMTVGNKALGNLVVKEETIGTQSIREYVITVDEQALLSDIAVSMYIGPMSRDVNFTIKAELDRAYKISDYVQDNSERPALFVPIIQAESAAIIKAVGSVIEIPTATAMLGDEVCKVEIAVYYDGASKEYIEIENNAFTPTKTGTYYIVYTAKSDSYKTSKGNPTVTVFERKVTVGKSGDVTPDDKPTEEMPDIKEDNESNSGDMTWLYIAAPIFVAVIIIAIVIRKRR